jgi:hypothetical protein
MRIGTSQRLAKRDQVEKTTSKTFSGFRQVSLITALYALLHTPDRSLLTVVAAEV